MAWHDAVGTLGVALILGAYAAMHAGRLRAETVTYSLLNAVGAALILVSLTHDFNLSAVIVESAWLLISLAGAWKWRHSRLQETGTF